MTNEIAGRPISYRENDSSNLVFRYGSCYVLMFTLGLIGYYLLKVPFSDWLNGCIVSYFSAVFDRSANIGSNLSLLFSSSLGDIRILLLLFLSGFTMFSSIAIVSLLGFHALSLGFSAAYLVGALSAGVLSGVRFTDLVLFLFGRAAVCALFILFGARSRLFCDEFRSLGSNTRRILRCRELYRLFFSLLFVSGAILAINLLRFLFNAFFLKGS